VTTKIFNESFIDTLNSNLKSVTIKNNKKLEWDSVERISVNIRLDNIDIIYRHIVVYNIIISK